MMALRYPHLFEPIRLGDVLFRNRIFASPTGYQNVAGDNTLPDGAAPHPGEISLAVQTDAPRRDIIRIY